MITKFDYCISNPPYQMDRSNEFNNSASNIFHFFYDTGSNISSRMTMIFPGGRWIQRSSKSREASNIIYPSVRSIEWFPNGKEHDINKIFPHVLLNDGVCIVHYDSMIEDHVFLNGEKFRRPSGSDILPLSRDMSEIIRIILSKYDSYVVSRKFPRGFFGLPSYYTERYPDKVSTVRTDEYDTPAWLANENKGTGKRVKLYYLKNDDLSWNTDKCSVYSKYKVCTPQGNASKFPGLTSYYTVDKNSVVGESWLIVGVFDTKEEADNYSKYLETKLIRRILDESKGGNLRTWGYFVPDLGDYSNENPDIDWSKPLDPQLHKLFNLSEEEIKLVVDESIIEQ